MKNKETQLNLWGLSLDQNHFTSMIWGILDFVPTASDKWKDTCRHCLLWNNEKGQTTECLHGVKDALMGITVTFQFTKCR